RGARPAGRRVARPPVACRSATTSANPGVVERSAALARGLIVIAALLAPRASAQPAPESAAPARATDAAADRPAPPRWCAEELSELGDGMCYFEAAADAPPTTLILFLHTLVGANSSWQWEQQRLMARTAKAHGLAVLMPRGRRGIGPGRAPDVWAWPTSARAQAKVEDELVAEWQAARAAVETKRGRADRKSTRLNSSHVKSSYADFCLKKKTDNFIYIRIQYYY